MYSILRKRQFVRVNAKSLKGCIFWFKITNDDIIYEWAFEASEVSLKIKWMSYLIGP